MSELSDLYQEVILDHNRRPRNWGALPDETGHAEGYNPLCGDRLTLHVKVDGDTLTGISFEGSGCAISKASASMMTDAIIGKPIDEARGVFDRFIAMITAPVDQPAPEDDEQLGSLVALAGVREFPMRVKCASLAWHTLKSALVGADEGPVKTE